MLNMAVGAAKMAGELIKAKLGADVVVSKMNGADLLTEVDGKCQDIIYNEISNKYPSHDFLGEESVDAGVEASTLAVENAADSEWLWICDPIDGTTNFASGMPLVGVIISLAYKGEVVMGVIYDPFHDEMYTAIKGGGAYMNGQRIGVAESQSVSESVLFTVAPVNPQSAPPLMRSITALNPPVSRAVRMLGTGALMLSWVAIGRASAFWEVDLHVWDSAAGVLLVREAGGRCTDLEGNEWGLTTRPLLATNGAIHDELLQKLQEVDCVNLEKRETETERETERDDQLIEPTTR